MKTKFTYILFITGVMLFVVVLYPLFVFLCIFKPLKVRGFFIKLVGTFHLVKWLETIIKEKQNGI
jgi:hypothetical protein